MIDNHYGGYACDACKSHQGLFCDDPMWGKYAVQWVMCIAPHEWVLLTQVLMAILSCWVNLCNWQRFWVVTASDLIYCNWCRCCWMVMFPHEWLLIALLVAGGVEGSLSVSGDRAHCQCCSLVCVALGCSQRYIVSWNEPLLLVLPPVFACYWLHGSQLYCDIGMQWSLQSHQLLIIHVIKLRWRWMVILTLWPTPVQPIFGQIGDKLAW
jgi:hypothetical protein